MLNITWMIHKYIVLQDAVRTGVIVAMDSRVRSETCSPSCANAEVRRRMRQVGVEDDLRDSDIQLGDLSCTDGGYISWRMEEFSWHPSQEYVVCATTTFTPFGPFTPDMSYQLHAEIHGQRSP